MIRAENPKKKCWLIWQSSGKRTNRDTDIQSGQKRIFCGIERTLEGEEIFLSGLFF